MMYLWLSFSPGTRNFSLIFLFVCLFYFVSHFSIVSRIINVCKQKVYFKTKAAKQTEKYRFLFVILLCSGTFVKLHLFLHYLCRNIHRHDMTMMRMEKYLQGIKWIWCETNRFVWDYIIHIFFCCVWTKEQMLLKESQVNDFYWQCLLRFCWLSFVINFLKIDLPFKCIFSTWLITLEFHKRF